MGFTNKPLGRQHLFWMAILTPLLISVAVMALIGLQLTFCLAPECFQTFFGYARGPAAIAAISIPLATLVAKLHGSFIEGQRQKFNEIHILARQRFVDGFADLEDDVGLTINASRLYTKLLEQSQNLSGKHPGKVVFIHVFFVLRAPILLFQNQLASAAEMESGGELRARHARSSFMTSAAFLLTVKSSKSEPDEMTANQFASIIYRCRETLGDVDLDVREKLVQTLSLLEGLSCGMPLNTLGSSSHLLNEVCKEMSNWEQRLSASR
ncbi:hypothetical protein [Isoalcanivorax beigongshangi]|uniref:Uncharacterized protein n=1 Tax=Isoalcanivorax beigongshangi TaxID=3238810 RepID=A0ABV4AHQ7_9GAMM